MESDSKRQNRSWKKQQLLLAAGGSLLVAGILAVALWPESEPDSSPTLDAATIETSSALSTTTYPQDSPTFPPDNEKGVESEPRRSCAVGDPANPCHLLDNDTTFDPQWHASVTLGCGETPDTRTILAFEPETNDRGTASLMWSEPSGRIFQLEIGSEFPSSSRLGWAIQGYFLGPWDVDEVNDTCVSS